MASGGNDSGRMSSSHGPAMEHHQADRPELGAIIRATVGWPRTCTGVALPPLGWNSADGESAYPEAAMKRPNRPSPSLPTRPRGTPRRRGVIAPRAGVRRARQQERLAAILKATAALTGASSIESMLAHLAEAASRAVGRSHAELYLFSPDRSRIELVCAFGLSSEEQVILAGTADIPIGGFWAERRAMETLRPVEQVIDAAQLFPDIERSFRRVGKIRTLVTPLLADGQMIGCFDMWTPHDDRPFAPGDVAAAAAVGRQAGLAIQNVRLREGDRQRVREQAALVRVGEAAISGADLDQVLDVVARATLDTGIGEACDVELWRREDDVMELVATAAVPGWSITDPLGTRYRLTDWPSTREALGLNEPQSYGVDDARLDAGERRRLKDDQVGSILELPLRVGEESLGVLVIYDRAAHRFGRREIAVGQELAAQAALAIQNTRLQMALRQQAETDGLTGLLNHRAIQEYLDRLLIHPEWDRTAGDAAGAVLLVDIDDFKLFNDTHGHLVGDRVLRDVAQVLRDVVRPDDRVGRYGGDEFLLVLSDASRGETVAEALLSGVRAMSIAVDELDLPLRLSVGLATAPRDGTTRAQLIAAADAAMYAAKEAGVSRIAAISHTSPNDVSSAFSALSGLVLAVDRKDRYTKQHSDQVTAAALRFGRALDLDSHALEALRIAGQLHDVGKIAVPDAILRKPAGLTNTERAVMERHVEFSVLMVQAIMQDEAAIDAIGQHHERWDGRGYPLRRAGSAISPLGRILALTDAYAAMLCDRPYRKGLGFERIIAELWAGAGSQFEPALVARFIEWLEGERRDIRDSPGSSPARESGLRLADHAAWVVHDGRPTSATIQ